MPCCGNSIDTVKDTCDCTVCCRYPNGPIPIILAQIILFVGAMFASEAMVDCWFVSAKIANIVGERPVNLPETLESYLPTDKRRGLGFFSWELANGECSYDLKDDLSEDLVDDYIDFLGGDWRAPRGMGTTTASLSWVIWIWVLVFTCVSHTRYVRYLVCALCLLILVVFQSVTFAVITSDFCDDADCELGRGAGFSIAAVLCFFFSGFLFLVMRDYPGDRNAAAAAAATAGAGSATSTGKGAGADEEADRADSMEEQTSEHVEDDDLPTEEVVNEDLPTEEVANEEVVNDGIADVQEIEAPSDPFVGSTDPLVKAVPE
jgi:hypothetical protein